MNNLKILLPKAVGTLLILASFISLPNQKVQAQDGFGLGIQFGSPSGISIKKYNASGMSLDVLAAWDLDRFFYVNVHGIWEQPLGSSPFNLLYGPGAFWGIERQRNTVEEGKKSVVGLSGTIGVNIYLGQVEVFGVLTPQISLTNTTEFRGLGGVGFRYMF